jgi:hypothetical protein
MKRDIHMIDKNTGTIIYSSKLNVPKRTRKLSEKELMIRKFRKFLYDNDALESWYKYAKEQPIHGSIKKVFKERAERWISYAFQWSNTHEDNDYWVTLAIKWDTENVK